MVLAFGHTLRAHEALRCPDDLSGLLEVLTRKWSRRYAPGGARRAAGGLGELEHLLVYVQLE